MFHFLMLEVGGILSKGSCLICCPVIFLPFPGWRSNLAEFCVKFCVFLQIALDDLHVLLLWVLFWVRDEEWMPSLGQPPEQKGRAGWTKTSQLNPKRLSGWTCTAEDGNDLPGSIQELQGSQLQKGLH